MPLKFIAAGIVLALKVRNRAHEQTSPAVIAGEVEAPELKPAPIDPSWILSGQPEARCATHPEAEDHAVMSAIWDCTAGTFRWYFSWEETVVILEGEVEVTAEDGTVSVLRKGDIGYFAGGTWATWRVENYVKKVAFMPRPLPMARAVMARLTGYLKPEARQDEAA